MLTGIALGLVAGLVLGVVFAAALKTLFHKAGAEVQTVMHYHHPAAPAPTGTDSAIVP